ncbi:MAG: acetylxylan esterase, partial [Lentisphaeria bacterium]|nr:acetylxylan esterase [Lentisphaeria bacterium]
TLGRIAPNCGVPYTSEMDYYDAAYHAKRVKCPVVIPRAGIGDYTCPPSGIAVAYNNIKTPKAIYWMQGSTHGYIPEGNGKVNGNHSGPDTFKINQK